MKLKAKVKSLADVDEKYHDLYVKQDDGSFRLDAEGMETEDEVASLKEALKRERELNKKKGEDGLTKAERDELAQLRKDREEAEAKQLENEKNWKGLETRLKEKHAKELETESTKAKTATERLFKTLKENAATAAIAKAKGRVAPLLPHVISKLDVIEKDGDLRVIVKGDDGARYSKEDPKKEMSVDELIATDFLSNEDFMGVFDGTGHSGSGTQGGGNGGKRGGTVTISKEDAKDAAKYRAAKEAAKKAGQASPVVV